MNKGYQYQTIIRTYELICKDESPWIAIGNFLNDWWFYAVPQRPELIKTPLLLALDKRTQRWAAFCAAMVDTLCEQCNIRCPDWTKQEQFQLSQPWFYYKASTSRSWLLATTPASFKRHNVYMGNNVLSGKWDLPTSSTLNPNASPQTDQRVRV